MLPVESAVPAAPAQGVRLGVAFTVEGIRIYWIDKENTSTHPKDDVPIRFQSM